MIESKQVLEGLVAYLIEARAHFTVTPLRDRINQRSVYAHEVEIHDIIDVVRLAEYCRDKGIGVQYDEAGWSFHK